MLVSLVLAGGAFGALSRYLLSMFIARRLDGRFPWATLTVNLLGCFALGVAAQLTRAGGLAPLLQPFITVGILGSFTTFSTFSVEAAALFEGGRTWAAFAYVAASCFAGLAAFILGTALAASAL